MPRFSSFDRQSIEKEFQSRVFDLLVIGGGATGAGIALDAVTRGLSVALIDRGDFASGTSSRSTKLIHGGVRYLEKAVMELDRGQYHLVREALQERGILLRIAPHLTRPLPLLTPLYRRWEVPYYIAGLKMYEWLAGDQALFSSRYVSRKESLELCPMLKQENLRGGVLYYDGQFDDARMNVSILTKAAELGAQVANYISAEAPIVEGEKSKLSGFQVHDRISDRRYSIRAKVCINAAGPYCDALRQLTDPGTPKILEVSSGAHLVLPREFSARESGLLIPKTDDGRVLFLLPWLGHTLVGTTDMPAKLSTSPQASDEEVQFILEQLSKYFAVKVTTKDILAAWAGLRPLVSAESQAGTAQISREHHLDKLPSGLVTITGGKWTTYRVMAEETVDFCIEHHLLKAQRPSGTAHLPLTGAENFSKDTESQLAKKFGWDPLTAKYLSRAYGGNAFAVSEMSQRQNKAVLVSGQPHLRAEVDYAVEKEFACSSADILARRLRLAFLDSKAALKALPVVNEILAQKLHWTEAQSAADKETSLAFLQTLSWHSGKARAN